MDLILLAKSTKIINIVSRRRTHSIFVTYLEVIIDADVCTMMQLTGNIFRNKDRYLVPRFCFLERSTVLFTEHSFVLLGLATGVEADSLNELNFGAAHSLPALVVHSGAERYVLISNVAHPIDGYVGRNRPRSTAPESDRFTVRRLNRLLQSKIRKLSGLSPVNDKGIKMVKSINIDPLTIRI